MMRSTRRRLIALALFLLPLLAAVAAAQEPPSEAGEAPAGDAADTTPRLALTAVAVTPPAPGIDTLCQLRVEIANRGEQPASMLAFRVSLDGQPLPVYANQLYMQELPAGQTSEVRLYNFWTTETGRPAPADGAITVEVVLTEAQWMKIAEDEEGVETWTPLAPVEGLPVSASLTVKLARPPAPPAAGSGESSPASS
jgi:hypothetical protein